MRGRVETRHRACVTENRGSHGDERREATAPVHDARRERCAARRRRGGLKEELRTTLTRREEQNSTRVGRVPFRRLRSHLLLDVLLLLLHRAPIPRCHAARPCLVVSVACPAPENKAAFTRTTVLSCCVYHNMHRGPFGQSETTRESEEMGTPTSFIILVCNLRSSNR